MNLYLSDDRFLVGGQPYVGFPILIDKSGRVVEVALRFLVHALLRSGGALDPKTWLAYGRHMYDYFGYLEERPLLQWDALPSVGSGDIPALAHYVRWCHGTVGNSEGYINDKVGTLRRFYEWAQEAGLTEGLPFQYIDVPTRRTGHLRHASGRGGRARTSNLNLREPSHAIRVLTRSQVDSAIRMATNPTCRAVLYLGLSAGLRAEELATFPARYVVDCSRLSPKVRNVAVHLNPNDMDTKNGKARTVRISVGCMNLLWQYGMTTRERLSAVSGKKDRDVLFLTRYGLPYAADGFLAPLTRLGQRIGIHLHPHMLRHTFATHTLASLEELRRQGRFHGSPLTLVRDLLGHASIVTTSRYLHFLHEINDAYGTKYQEEIDSIAASLQ